MPDKDRPASIRDILGEGIDLPDIPADSLEKQLDHHRGVERRQSFQSMILMITMTITGGLVIIGSVGVFLYSIVTGAAILRVGLAAAVIILPLLTYAFSKLRRKQ